MKKIFKFLFLSVVLIFAACEDIEPTIYEGNSSDQALVQFSSITYDLGIPVSTSKELEIQVSASNRSDQDRTYQVELLEEDISDNLDYNFDQTVTIPAGELFGTLTVTATDNGINDEVSVITLELIPNTSSEEVLEDNETTISIFQTCPIPDDRYTGTWNVTTSGCFGNGSGGCANQYSGIESTVEIMPIEDGGEIIGFETTDITGGLYPVGYGDGPNPANVFETCNNLSFTDQPDVVYGGDVFNGTGSIQLDSNGNMISFTINWSNGYGDSGTSVYTPAE